MKVPRQKFFVGDLIQSTKDWWPHLKKGQCGVITLARCDEVCVKGGYADLTPEDGGPEYAMEWCYVGRFDMNTTPQGVRLDRLSPIEAISD